MKLEHLLTGYTKNTIKMDKTLKTIKLQEENIGSKLLDTGLSDNILNLYQKQK